MKSHTFLKFPKPGRSALAINVRNVNPAYIRAATTGHFQTVRLKAAYFLTRILFALFCFYTSLTQASHIENVI